LTPLDFEKALKVPITKAERVGDIVPGARGSSLWAPPLILAIRTGKGPGSDSKFLPHLRRMAGRWGRKNGRSYAWLAVADAGFEKPTLSLLLEGEGS